MKLFLNVNKELLFNDSKVRELVDVCCFKCSKEFSRAKRTVQITLKRGYNLYCSKNCAEKVNETYNSCLNCSKPTSTKFCDQSCAASFNNRKRTRVKKQILPKSKISVPLKVRICECGVIDYTRSRFQSLLCKFCSGGLTYRESCKFRFNLKDYPDEFDFKLLETYGMFNPKTNPKGVSRDHIYSVADGKRNKIDGDILAHPANCRLVLQGDNTRKQGKSDITLEELLLKIEIWNNKYSDLQIKAK